MNPTSRHFRSIPRACSFTCRCEGMDSGPGLHAFPNSSALATSAKAVSQANTGNGTLLRKVRRWDLVALLLNSVIGSGIFGLPGRAYALANVYSLLAYLICAVIVLLVVLCFAEVSSRFKETGGLYAYARATFGSFVGFEIGWLAWLTRLTAFAALCNLFVDYLGYFLPASATGTGRAVVMVLVVSGLAVLNLLGVRLASLFGNVFTIGKTVPLILLVVAGFFFIDPQRFSPAFTPSYAQFSASVLLLVFAFTGFEIIVIPAGEARNPQRDMPFALLVGITIVVLLYLAIQAVCIGTLPELGKSPRPLAEAGARIFGATGAAIISLGALISMLGTMNAIMLASPRLLFAMAEQRQLPLFVAATHKRFHTPHVAILLSAAPMLALCLSGSFASSAILSTIIRLTTYAMTCAALPLLRRRKGESPAFVAPGGRVVSVLSLLLILWLYSSTSWPEARQAVIAAGVGLVLYLVVGRVYK